MVGRFAWGAVEVGWRKGPWTAQEDKLLLEHVRLHGDGRWNHVSPLSGLKRGGKSCRLRWVNYLRPGLKRGKITPHEEKIIVELQATWGNRWSTIARSLPGRTDNEIKNYWRTHFKKPKSCKKLERARPAHLLRRSQQEEERQQQQHGDLPREQPAEHQVDMRKIFPVLLEEEDESYQLAESLLQLVPEDMCGAMPYVINLQSDGSLAEEEYSSDEGAWGGCLWNLDDAHVAGAVPGAPRGDGEQQDQLTSYYMT